MKVALLGHSSTHEEFTYAFGLYRLLAYCRAAGIDDDITVLDRSGDDDEAADLELLRAESPDVVGLSAYLWNLPRVTRLVSEMKAWKKPPLVVVGGPSARGYDDIAADRARPDLLVVGFGERTFANLLKSHALGRLQDELASVGHVISYRGGLPRTWGAPNVETTLDELPSPYLDGSARIAGKKTLYVETDRGCPYSCAFCIESTAPPKVARFSHARVEAELAWAIARGIEQIELCSAIFNLDTAWLRRFVESVERVDPNRTLSFSAALFTTHLSEEQGELFGRLRMKSALFGLNSIYRPTFKDVRRAIDPARFREKIELFARWSRPQVSLIMGLPGDTPDGLRETLAFANTLPADVMMFRFMVLPGTLYYERRADLKLEIDFEHDNRILSTHSYSRDDLRRMEAIAASAGFDEVNPGEWVRREGRERFAPAGEMSRRHWGLLYKTLQAMKLDASAWPDGCRFVRVFLDAPRFAGVTFGCPSGRVDLYACEEAKHPPRFARTRHFDLVARPEHARAPAPASLLEAFARAFDEAERRVLAGSSS